jgi:outer membrane protein assembly factor BamB
MFGMSLSLNGLSNDRRVSRQIAIGVFCVFLSGGLEAADWSIWRGPARNGIADETNWNPAAIDGGAKIAWKKNVGQGYSAVSVDSGRLFTMGNRQKRDTISCLAARTGTPVWEHSYACKPGSYPGPRATPVLDGGNVYTLGRDGQLLCLGADDGKVIWERNVRDEFGAKAVRWGFASSPYIDGDVVLVNVGRYGVAVNKKDGKKVWASPSDTCGYATPVLFDHGGQRIAAMFGAKALYAVDAGSGKLLWSVGWETSYDVNAADPIVSGDRVFISSGYNRGGTLLEMGPAGAKKLWENKNMRCHFGTCVLLEGYLYGIDGNTGKGSLKCVEFSTGKVVWEQKLGFGALMLAGRRLIVLNERGQLFIADAVPTGYKELSQCLALPSKGAKCWTAPVLCNGYIYCRNSRGDMVAVDVSE